MPTPLALGVITSVQPDPNISLASVKSLGVPTIQIDYPGSLDNESGIAVLRRALAQARVEVTSVVCGFAGDDYADIETVRRTIGLVPEATRAERLAHVEKVAAFTERLGVTRLQTHVGHVPEDATDPGYPGVVAAMRTACDIAASHSQVFALETGQETAKTLQRFINDVDSPNLRVNFDPANMILYGNDNPIQALDLLMSFIDGVHCKDGKWPTEPGKLGCETPLGEGDVDFASWLEKLIVLGYQGPLTIEREIHGEQQQKDILKAIALIESVLAGVAA